MKAKLFFIVSAILMASCSAPKYSYKFDYHDYNAGRKKNQAMKEVASNPGPLEIQPEMLVAEAPVAEPAGQMPATAINPKSKSAPLTLSKAEKKEMVKDLRRTVRSAVRMKNTGDVDHSTNAMDYDLKMALIFLVVSFAAGLLYWVSPPLAGLVGLIAIIVSIVFFIKWLMRQ